MRRKTILTSVFVVILLVVSPVAAFTVTDTTVFESWEDYTAVSNIEANYDTVSAQDRIDLNKTYSTDGSTSIKYTIGGSGVDPAVTNQFETITADETSNTTVEFDLRVEPATTDIVYLIDVGIQDNESGQEFELRFDNRPVGSHNTVSGDHFDVSNSFGSDGVGIERGTAESVNNGVWQHFEMTLAWPESRAYVHLNGTEVYNESISGSWTSGNLSIAVASSSPVGDASRLEAWVDDIRVDTAGTGLESSELELDIETFMEPGETQAYNVTLTETYINGTVETTNVTEDANLTSNDTTLLTIDNASDTLVATGDENARGVVAVTAEYQGVTTEKNVTFAPITADNLDIIPSDQRILALFNGDNEDRQPGAGSPFMIILIAVLVGIGAANASTAFGGIGAMQLVFLAGWFAGYIGTGLMLVTVFYAVFVGLNLAGNVDIGSIRG